MGLLQRLRANADVGNVLLVLGGLAGVFFSPRWTDPVSGWTLSAAMIVCGLLMWVWPRTQGVAFTALGLTGVAVAVISLVRFGPLLVRFGLLGFGLFVVLLGLANLLAGKDNESTENLEKAEDAQEYQEGENPDV